MSMPKIGNRTGREGKLNPGRQHLRGADVTQKMQRQYEHILQSLREYRRYGSDKKRKQVAASTVRKMQQNPRVLASLFRNLGIGIDDESRAELLAEKFHGRPVRDTFEVTEREAYDEHSAVLGYLRELNILMDDGDSVIPIRFADDDDPLDEDTVFVASNPGGTNLEFVGGDQKIDWRSVDGASMESKHLVYVGPVYSIAYFTDKHHLTGPKEQKYGTTYEHEFGEDDGELPHLVYDRRNEKMLLVGGSYSVKPEGIDG